MKTIISEFLKIIEHSSNKVFANFYSLIEMKNYSYLELYELALIYSKKSKPGVNLIISDNCIDVMACFLGILMAGENHTPALLSPINQKEHSQIYQNKIDNIIKSVKPSTIFNKIDEKDFFVSYYDNYETKNQKNSFLQFSSGSTGLQKGVEITSNMFFEHLKSFNQLNIEMDSTSSIFSWLPLYHDLGLLTGFLIPLMQSSEVHFMSPYYWISNPKIMMEIITKENITHCFMPNFAFSLFASNKIELDVKWNLSSLDCILSCGEPCYRDDLKSFYDKYKNVGLRKESITTALGMAENVCLTSYGIDENFEPWTKPLPNVYLKLAEDGEILIKSPFLLEKYYNSSELILDKDGYFLTGDLGEINFNGEIRICGRKKDLIIIQGKNIFPNDIEKLMNGFLFIPFGRSVVLSKQENGTESLLVIAEIDNLLQLDLKQKLRINTEIRKKIIDEFDSLPISVLQVPKGWLIKTSSGKIARKANYEKYLKHQEYIKIFEKNALDILFRREFDGRLLISDNLFELGFSSLDMFEYMMLIEKELGIGMAGATGKFGQGNNCIRDLVFWLENKISKQL